MELAKEMGERLKARRLACALTQGQLAAATGLTQVEISKYERGDFATINPAHLCQLVEVLKTTADHVLGRVKAPPLVQDKSATPRWNGRRGRKPAALATQ